MGQCALDKIVRILNSYELDEIWYKNAEKEAEQCGFKKIVCVK